MITAYTIHFTCHSKFGIKFHFQVSDEETKSQRSFITQGTQLFDSKVIPFQLYNSTNTYKF